jgi:hypothetical protein
MTAVTQQPSFRRASSFSNYRQVPMQRAANTTTPSNSGAGMGGQPDGKNGPDWLLLKVRDNIPKLQPLAVPERTLGFKVAWGRLPDSGDDLCLQPAMSRWESADSARGDGHDMP